MSPLRRTVLLLHRYTGLVIAAFLVVAGLTGAPLAWYDELDAALNPQWLRVQPPSPQAQPLSPLLLRAQVQRAYPEARVHFMPLVPEKEGAAIFFIGPGSPPAAQAGAAPSHNQVFVDPYTGRVLGGRHWGALDGLHNLLPFIYRLHMELALGVVGHRLFGVVALLWTLDCFVGAALTLPARGGRTPAGSWWRRWQPAWRVRRAGAYRIGFDLHRAGGLWLWACLFVFAWSSVALNLHEAYDPVMHTLFESQEARAAPGLSAPAAIPAPEPAMGWEAGLARGRALMAGVAREKGFTVLHEQRLSYRPHRGDFQYRVRSDRDIRDRRGITSVDFDAATGRLLAVYLPTGEASGDTVTGWLLAWHMADVWGQPFKVAVFLMGLATAGLSGTGAWIWWRKRKGRLAGAARARRAACPLAQQPGSPPSP